MCSSTVTVAVSGCFAGTVTVTGYFAGILMCSLTVTVAVSGCFAGITVQFNSNCRCFRVLCWNTHMQSLTVTVAVSGCFAGILMCSLTVTVAVSGCFGGSAVQSNSDIYYGHWGLHLQAARPSSTRPCVSGWLSIQNQHDHNHHSTIILHPRNHNHRRVSIVCKSGLHLQL